MRIREGFPGQRLRVLPPDTKHSAISAGLTSRLLVTDAGYYPNAEHHGATRQHGARGTIVIVASSGSGGCRSREVSVRVQAGQALLIPAMTPHRYWADDSDPWTIWWMHVAGDDAAVFETQTIPDQQIAVVDLHDRLHTIGELERVVRAMETDDTAPNLLRAAGSAWSVLAQLCADAASGSQARSEPIRATQEYLRTHLDARVDVGQLASRAGLSTSHFAARFREATGGGVIAYVKRLRMAQACELLMTTASSVTEVARAVGYEDAYYFSRQFRDVHACSPTQFRKHGLN